MKLVKFKVEHGNAIYIDVEKVVAIYEQDDNTTDIHLDMYDDTRIFNVAERHYTVVKRLQKAME